MDVSRPYLGYVKPSVPFVINIHGNHFWDVDALDYIDK